MAKAKETRRLPYKSISLPARLMEEIAKIVKQLGYWPTKTDFIREACLQKLEKHRRELEARRRVAEEAEGTSVT